MRHPEIVTCYTASKWRREMESGIRFWQELNFDTGQWEDVPLSAEELRWRREMTDGDLCSDS